MNDNAVRKSLIFYLKLFNHSPKQSIKFESIESSQYTNNPSLSNKILNNFEGKDFSLPFYSVLFDNIVEDINVSRFFIIFHFFLILHEAAEKRWNVGRKNFL